MTDARLRGEWLSSLRFSSLSDTAWRVFTGALMWSAEQETDGVIPMRFLRTLHPSFDDLPDVYAEITAAGLWAMSGDQVELLGWARRGLDGLGQSTAEQVRTYREGSRKRQQQYRDRRKGSHGAHREFEAPSAVRVTGNATRDVTGDETANVGSLSFIDRSTERAYVTPDVTHNEEPPSRFCSRHPDGSDGAPCGACRDARLAREDWDRDQKLVSTPIAPRVDLTPMCGTHSTYPSTKTSPCAKCAREFHERVAS